MSGIAGTWNLDGAPADVAALSLMTAALNHRGPDGEGRRAIGSTAFACQHSWATPEEVGEIQPLAGRRGILLAFDGRIDNRDELLSALNLPSSASDAACALAGYEQWDDEFASKLNGDFAVAIFDESKQRLLLARDAIGIRPLYYFRSPRLFAFASEIKGLLAHPDVPARADEEGIADYLLLGFRPLDRQEITCFAGVSAVVPSHVVSVTRTHLASRRYWDFDPRRALRLRTFGECVEGFRSHFAAAVKRRLRSHRPVAMSVSGGLDSSSVFCQAETLRARGETPCPRVVAISYTGAPGTDADERQYLIEIERRYDVSIDRFPVEPLRGLARGMAEQLFTVEAPFPDYMWGVTRELHHRAARSGARVFLSGLWGDQVLFSSAYLVDLFGRLKWPTIRRHLRGYRAYFGREETGTLTRRFVSDIARYHLPRAILRPLKQARLRWLERRRDKGYFAAPFLDRALRFANEPATIGSGFHSAQAKSLYAEPRSKYHVHCMEGNNKIGAWCGVDAAFPFLDRDLLAFLMATPGEQQNRDGVPRALLREAMRGVLPEAVRARTWKADFTGVVNDSVGQDVEAIATALTADSLAVRLGFLDPTRLAPAVARLSSRISADNCLSSWDLADLYGFEVWLQLFFAAPAAVPLGGFDDAQQTRHRIA